MGALVALWQVCFPPPGRAGPVGDLLQAAAGALRRVGVPQVCLVSGDAAPASYRAGLGGAGGGGMRRIPNKGRSLLSFPSSPPSATSSPMRRTRLSWRERGEHATWRRFLLITWNREQAAQLVPENEQQLPGRRVQPPLDHRGWLRVEKPITVTPECDRPTSSMSCAHVPAEEMRALLLAGQAVRAYGSLVGETNSPTRPAWSSWPRPQREPSHPSAQCRREDPSIDRVHPRPTCPRRRATGSTSTTSPATRRRAAYTHGPLTSPLP